MDICYKWKRQDCKQVLPRLKVLKEREREDLGRGDRVCLEGPVHGFW